MAEVNPQTVIVKLAVHCWELQIELRTNHYARLGGVLLGNAKYLLLVQSVTERMEKV